MSLSTLALCLLCAIVIGAGQILMKLAAGDMGGRSSSDMWSVVQSPWLVAALLSYGASTLLWVYVLTQVALTKAYPFTLLGAAMVPTLAWLILGEPLTTNYVIGMALVLVGLVVMYAV